MQHYLYKIQPVRLEMLSEGPTEAESRIVSDHFSYLKDLVERGAVILAGRTLNNDYSSFGIIIFKAESEDQARETVRNDPAVKNNVMRAELYPYRIALLKAENAE
ncbi:MAG TPA: YciI family protein [Candidatus Bathyarchaeia archaeon]